MSSVSKPDTPTANKSQTTVETSQHALEVDETPTPHDASEDVDVDSSNSTFTTSLASSVYNFKYENGRRYHAYREGEYVLPNDDLEQERLNFHHHMWRFLVGGALYTVPLTQPKRILDLGTGTGIWAIDMADEFPSSEIQGIDLSPIQPQWVPPNCTFHVDDYDGDWTWSPTQAFDYIHGRALSGTCNDWTKFYRQAFDNLTPGGWIEMQEYDAWIFSYDDSCDRAKWTMQWVNQVDQASKSFGKQLNIADRHKQWMIDAGFQDINEMIYRMPIGPWAKDRKQKEFGTLERAHMQMSVESHTPALYTRVLGYSHEQTRELIDNVKGEFRDRSLHLYTVYRFVTGRRPE